MLSNPLTAKIIENHDRISWAGHLRHIIGYRIASGEYYNLVLTTPDEQSDAPLAVYNQPGDLEEMQRDFGNWDDAVTVMRGMVDSCVKWTLAELPALPTWWSPDGRVVLVGDAAHAITPHAASGAALTLEDAEVLGYCIPNCCSLQDLGSAMVAYKKSRKERCEHVKKLARENAVTFSLPDGPEQQARDAKLNHARSRFHKELMNGQELRKPTADMNKPFPHPDVVMWLYGYNAVAEAKSYLQSERE